MGALTAIFLVLSLNLAPVQTGQVTIHSYIVEGVGYTDQVTEFRVTPLEDGRWLMHDAFGDPWFEVEVQRSTLSLTDLGSGVSEAVDMAEALGVPDEAWWTGEALTPPGAEPLSFSHLANGVDVTLEGVRIAEIRW